MRMLETQILVKARENAVDRHLKVEVKGKAMKEIMTTNLPRMPIKAKLKEAPEAEALAKAKAKAKDGVIPKGLMARVRGKAKVKLNAADHLLKEKAKARVVRNHVLSLPKVFVLMETSAGTVTKVDQLKLMPLQPIPQTQDLSLRRTGTNLRVGPQLRQMALQLLCLQLLPPVFKRPMVLWVLVIFLTKSCI